MKRGDKCPRCGYVFKKFSALRCPKCQLPLNPDDLRKYAEELDKAGRIKSHEKNHWYSQSKAIL